MVVLWIVNNALPEAEFLLSGRKTEIKTLLLRIESLLNYYSLVRVVI